jgi:hypothetical protein
MGGGLGSSSGELGHNVMDHHFGAGASGRVEGYEDKYYWPPSLRLLHSAFPQRRGRQARLPARFGYQGGASRTGWSREIAELNIGADLKEALTVPGDWRIGMTGFGEMLPHHDNTIRLDRDRKGQVGAAGAGDGRVHARQRTGDAQGHGRRCRDAGGGWRQGREDARQRLRPGQGHPRDGDRAHGT